MLLPLLLAAVVIGGASVPAAAFSEPYVFPPTPSAPYPMERSVYRPFSQLAALLASNETVFDPTGSLSPEDVPPTTPLTCGYRLPGTAHKVWCRAGPPLGGYVLVPPRPPTASIVYIHGYTDAPWFYSTYFRFLLTTSSDLFASVRVVVPLAPVYPDQRVAGAPPSDYHVWHDPTSFITETRPAVLNASDVAAVEAILRNDRAAVDRLGLFLSTRRIEAIISRERRVLHRACGPRCDDGGSGGGGGRVVLVGDGLGGVMTTHMALHSRARLDGVVSLLGFVTGARLLLNEPEAYYRGRRGYDVELVAGGDDQIVTPPLVEASARIVRRLLVGMASVRYTVLPRVTHTSFLPGREMEALVGVLRRFLP